jgi:salicylate hydroxylase
MHALLKHSHLQVDIFESGPEFSERGAAVGLSQNAQNALAEIGVGVQGAPDRAGAVKMHSSRLVIVRRINHKWLRMTLGAPPTRC